MDSYLLIQAIFHFLLQIHPLIDTRKVIFNYKWSHYIQS